MSSSSKSPAERLATGMTLLKDTVVFAIQNWDNIVFTITGKHTDLQPVNPPTPEQVKAFSEYNKDTNATEEQETQEEGSEQNDNNDTNRKRRRV